MIFDMQQHIIVNWDKKSIFVYFHDYLSLLSFIIIFHTKRPFLDLCL